MGISCLERVLGGGRCLDFISIYTGGWWGCLVFVERRVFFMGVKVEEVYILGF